MKMENVTFEKGQEVNVNITDMTDSGQGIGRANGLAVFVPGTVVGDEVTAKITKVKKNYAFSELIYIFKSSVNRIKSECIYAETCGGCTLNLLNYTGQVQLKEAQIRQKLIRIGGLQSPLIRPMVTMDTGLKGGPVRYRNKGIFPVTTGGVITRKGGIIENLGEVRIGFYQMKSRHVVDCTDCMLQSKAAMEAVKALRKFMSEDNITAWDPKWKKGLIRHIVVKTAFGTGEVMIVVVINGKGIPNIEKLIRYLDDAVYDVGYSLESVAININNEDTGKIFGDECIIAAGKGSIKEKVGDLIFEISPLSFYQVNPLQMEKMYDVIKEYTALSGSETVLDLYCGTGTISIWLAKHAGCVIGIESEKQAVLDANRNAVLNGITNAVFLHGRAEIKLKDLLEGKAAKVCCNSDKWDFNNTLKGSLASVDVAVLDPPRAGCRPELLKTISVIKPARIVYVSCDPATLARDIKILTGYGYSFVEATPVDMFPRTGHVETVALLSKLNVDKHISVEVELDELDLTSAESKATYAQIKEYILEKFGLKVSALYIAQIKKKCGIELRENYNKSKKEKQVIPQCTPEKEKAIMDALRHFKMI